MEQHKRLFIGLPVPSPLRSVLENLSPHLVARECHKNLRWIPPANYHITLEFLGQTAVCCIPILSTAMREAVAGMAAFDLALDTIAVFPDPRRPKVLAALPHPSDALHELRDALACCLREREFPVAAGSYRPHLTLARVRSRDLLELEVETLRPVDLTVDRITLFESVSGHGPVHYQVLHQLSLQK